MHLGTLCVCVPYITRILPLFPMIMGIETNNYPGRSNAIQQIINALLIAPFGLQLSFLFLQYFLDALLNTYRSYSEYPVKTKLILQYGTHSSEVSTDI